MNAYEIRHTIFQEASGVLHEHWNNKWEQECLVADRESRAPKLIDTPTMEEITTYADKVYQFVQKKD